MKGVMRVGDLAKGLLLANNLNIELVVLCAEKPTKAMLARVHEILPAQLKVTFFLRIMTSVSGLLNIGFSVS